MKTKLVKIAIGRWKSDKQARHVRERCIDSFSERNISWCYFTCIVPGN